MGNMYIMMVGVLMLVLSGYIDFVFHFALHWIKVEGSMCFEVPGRCCPLLED